MITDDLGRRLLYVLHRGLVEIRLLAQAAKMDQVHDLADVLEQMPAWLEGSADVPARDAIKSELQQYERRYPGSFNYSDFLDRYDPPAF